MIWLVSLFHRRTAKKSDSSKKVAFVAIESIKIKTVQFYGKHNKNAFAPVEWGMFCLD